MIGNGKVLETPVYIGSDTMNRFQTRVSLGGERENNVYKRNNWAA